jgi:DNA-binding CsgD family transcriptional regulator
MCPADRPPTRRPSPQLGHPLTEREIQILALVAAGEPTPAISARLGIAANTIKSHLASIYRKTGSRNRVQAVRFYLDHYTTDADPAQDPPKRSSPQRTSSLIQRQINELQSRVDQLAPAASELEQLQHALEALRAIESN